MDIAGKFGIVDIFFLVIWLRIVYIATSRGLLRELCKAAGLFCAVFFTFHFYPHLSEVAINRFSFINLNYLYPAAFLLIFAGVGLVFWVVNLLISLFLGQGEISAKKKLFLLGLGSVRAIVLVSFIFFFFNLISFRPGYVKNSLVYNLSRKVSPVLYLSSVEAVKYFNRDFRLNRQVEDYLKQGKPVNRQSLEI